MKIKIFIICVSLSIFSGVIYLSVMKGVRGNPEPRDLKNITEYSLRDRGRYAVTKNLVEQGTFSVTREQADLASPDAGYFNGKWYLLYPPGLSVLAIPLYLLGHYFHLSLVFSFLTSILFALGTVVCIFLICKKMLKLPIWASIFASLVFAFASTSLSYASSLFQHHVTAFLLISSIYAVHKYKKNSRYGFLWGIYIWISYSFSIFIDYPNMILLLPVLVYFFFTSIKFEKRESVIKLKLRSAFLLTAVFFIALSLLHGYFNKVNFGGWTTLSGSLPGYREGVDKALDKGTYKANISKFDDIQSKKKPTGFLLESLVKQGTEVSFFNEERGLFYYSPIFLLALFGIYYAMKKSSLEKSILLASILLVSFFYISFGDPWAGWSFGPRYLIPMMPALAIFVSYFLLYFRYKIVAKILTFLLFIYSSAVALAGALTTNAIPTRADALHHHIEYGLPYVKTLLLTNKTNDFFYTYYFHNHLTLIQYWAILLTVISLAAAFVLFILPKLEKENKE